MACREFALLALDEMRRRWVCGRAKISSWQKLAAVGSKYNLVVAVQRAFRYKLQVPYAEDYSNHLAR